MREGLTRRCGCVDASLGAEQTAREAMAIAADICVFTNDHLTVETLDVK